MTRSSDFLRVPDMIANSAGPTPLVLADPLRRPFPVAPRSSSTVSRLLVREEGRLFVVPTANVDWIETQGKHCRLHVGGRVHLLRRSLVDLAAQLDPKQFARIHRAVLVNLASVLEIEIEPGSNACALRLVGGHRLSVSRRHRRGLLDALASA